MARQRLTWQKEAAIDKKADPYTMNQDHANNPVEKYKTGDPSTWAEDPDMRKPWEGEGRTETGHPAPASEAPAAAPAAPAAPASPAAPAAPAAEPGEEEASKAVMAAAQLQDKALKCITIAQRMLPGATDDEIEKQATDLMYMPERCVLATLQRQVTLATKLASEDEDEDDKDGKEPVEAAAQEPEKVEPTEGEKPVEAKKEYAQPEKKPEDAPAAPAAPEGEPAKPEEEKTAGDMLEILFHDEPVKTGAKKLSGMVKQASAGSVDLSDLWPTAPDVSKAFGN